MKRGFLFLFFISFSCFGQHVPLPKSVFTINDLIEEFRGPLRTKIFQLSKNFIIDYKGTQLVFKSHEAIKCLEKTLASGEVLAKIEYFHKLSGDSLTETSNYYGCQESLSLREVITTKGKNLAPISFKNFTEGKRNFELGKDQESMVYRLINDQGLELFRLNQEWTKKGKTANFFILGQQFLNITYEYESERTLAIITYYGYSVKYHRPWSKWTMNNNFSPYSNKVYAYKIPKRKVEYIDSQNNRISESSFIEYFTYSALNRTFSKLKDFVKFHNYWFPATEVARAGGTSQRLINELRLNLTRLLNGTELNLVRLFVQDFIKAVEAGLITDRRPAE